MKDFLSSEDLLLALQEVCESTQSHCAFIIPSHALPFFDAETLVRALEHRPEVRCDIFFTSSQNEPGLESAMLQPLSRLPFVEVRETTGEFPAVFCNEMNSVLIPGRAHPLASAAGYSVRMGINEHPEVFHLMDCSSLVYRRTPQYSKKLFGLRKIYEGSSTESFSVCFRA